MYGVRIYFIDYLVLENSAPVFNVEEAVFNLTFNSLFQYTLSATDENGDTLRIRAEGLPAGATATQSGNSLTFTWQPDNTNPVRTIPRTLCFGVEGRGFPHFVVEIL